MIGNTLAVNMCKSEFTKAPEEKTKATLVLENGARFEGYSFGAKVSTSGEVVFQTGMVGYPEALTDPSYKSQILTLTFPLIGNYGVPDQVEDEHGISKWLESRRIWAEGLIVGELCQRPSHWNMKKTLDQWLQEQGVPGIEGIDTRKLTKVIREEGTMLAKIVLNGTDEDQVAFTDPSQVNLVREVSILEPQTFNPGGFPRILAVDCGLKFNQLRCLVGRGARVDVVPWNYDFKNETFDGLFLSNGPGDPQQCAETIANLKALLEAETSKPILGICLGHQLLAVALGCKTYKMKYGNRGHNQPCSHENSNRYTFLFYIRLTRL